MPNVDPFLVPIPPKLLKDRELSAFFRYWVRWSHDMWNAIDQGNAADNLDIAQLFSSVQSGDQLDIWSKIPYSTAVAFTTSGDMHIIVTAAVTITLNTTPEDGETVHVKRRTTAGNVTVAGPIDEDTNYIMLANHESKTFVYSAENSEWNIS